MTNTGKIATGVLVGTVLGAALGLLLAPKKGSKTRALIADKREVHTNSVPPVFSSGFQRVKP
jgi:gas vesicle protein